MENLTEIKSISLMDNPNKFSSPNKPRANLESLSILRKTSLLMKSANSKLLTEEEQILIVLKIFYYKILSV
jgi:hypothetical protein